ncbi:MULTISPECIES: type VI secretion system tip protein VgrG [unclassified Neptuniibacter]|uniref:type VI secretion system Vgr family protein n=1 Tax=unclassified Neptuniibacter TaxID=2630693 RepID=UPI0025F4C431|nr:MULTISPECIES: type VI secretion system tip protein VgrG [unclassified Neptuniibacter]|tara:strand:- start:5458 stop:7578 length:2121 start_codon:yes stop_codon:yes gene_type:complete
MFLKADEERFFFNVAESTETFQLVRMSGFETLSTAFEFSLELVSENPDIELIDLLNSSAVIKLLDQSCDENEHTRYIHGIISSAELGESGVRQTTYHLTLVPKIWPLRYRINSRIFQFKTVEEIITQLLEEAGLQTDEFNFQLSNSYAPRESCVQYRESDLAFIQRLLEFEGIHYYFEHHYDKHVLTLSDASETNTPVNGESVLPYFHDAQGAVREQHFFKFRYLETVRSGKVSIRDYDFKKPNLTLSSDDSHEQDQPLEIYEYPGEFTEADRGDALALAMNQSGNRNRKNIIAESDINRLLPGYSFELTDHELDQHNIEYLITHIEHNCAQPQVLEAGATTEGSRYTNLIHSIPFTTPFRPARKTQKPKVRGTQTAIVTGPDGEEIYTDEHGRVKVQFHWDREGQMDEQSSCWIRVSQSAAGGAFGGLFIPRIGEEVMVDFLEGNPDQPVITGRVYHGLNRTPYPLPENKTVSTIKTNSTKGGEGFNEIRFEDKKGEEQLFIHAQKDFDQRTKNDHKEWVGNDHHWIQMENEYRELRADEHALTHGNFHRQSDNEQHLIVDKKRHIRVGSNQATSAGQNIHVKAGNKIVLEAGVDMIIKAGGSSINVGPGGVTVNGSMVNLNSGGSAPSAQKAAPIAPTPPLEADIDQAGYVTPQVTNVDPWQASALMSHRMTSDRQENVAITEICQLQTDGSCPLSNCPCGNNS